MIYSDGFHQVFDIRSGTELLKPTKPTIVGVDNNKEDTVTCAIAKHIGTESGCVNGMKFSNSRVTALAEVEDVGILAGFRDGTLIQRVLEWT